MTKSKEKFQLEVCKAMMKTPHTVRKIKFAPNKWGLTYDGYQLMVFEDEDVVVQLEKIQTAGTEHMLDKHYADEVVTYSGKTFPVGKRTYMELAGETVKTYVNKKIFDSFNGHKMITNGQLSRILILDTNENVCGLILPVRYSPEEGQAC